MGETLGTLNDKVDQLLRLLDDLPRRLLVRANQIVVLGGLSDISETLGIIKAGEFRAGNRNEPGRGFSGMRLAYPPMAYSNDVWNLVGVENDVLQFGVRASDGKLLAGGGSVVLDQNGVTASAGTIAGWQIQPTKLVSPGTPGIQISSDGNIQTTDFTTDVKGWRIAKDGTAEFQNAKIRGELQTTIFTKREVQVTGGTLGIFKSAGVLLEDVTVTTGTFTIKIKDPQGVHEQLFAVNDILHLKDAANSTWVKVTAVTDNATYYTYTVQYQSGTSDVTYYAGQAVADYGSATSSPGHIIMSADDVNAPYISLRKHTGTPWSSVSELLKIGNLNGSWGYTSEKFGAAIGEYASGKANITIDEDGAIRIRNYTNEVLRVDTSGIRVGEYASGKPNVFIDATTGELKLRNYLTDVIVLSGADAKISSVLKVTDVNSAIAIGNPPPVSESSGTGLWIDRTGLYGLLNNNLQVKIGSDGKLYLGNGVVYMDSAGITVGSGNDILIISATDPNFFLWAGNVSSSLANFAITRSGVVYARNLNMSTAIVSRLSAQSIPNTVNTYVYYNSVVLCIPSSMYSASYTERLYAPIKGVYSIEAAGRFTIQTPASGFRQLAIYDQNGTVLDAMALVATNNSSSYLKCISKRVLNAGNYVYCMVYQDSGGNLDYTPYFFSLTLIKSLE